MSALIYHRARTSFWQQEMLTWYSLHGSIQTSFKILKFCFSYCTEINGDQRKPGKFEKLIIKQTSNTSNMNSNYDLNRHSTTLLWFFKSILINNCSHFSLKLFNFTLHLIHTSSCYISLILVIFHWIIY